MSHIISVTELLLNFLDLYDSNCPSLRLPPLLIPPLILTSSPLSLTATSPSQFMVHLVISSPKGNQGVRYFPYSGYLGLTPVKVEGVVYTKLDNDQKIILAKNITVSVRCYEARIGRVCNLHTNILAEYTQVLWSKPDDQEYADLAELELPFRIVLPESVAGFSTALYPDYRISWRVEAVINHIPITGVGSRQCKHVELALVRYDLPPTLLPPPSSSAYLNAQTTKHRAPVLRYRVDISSAPIGPMDLIAIPLSILPNDPNVFIRSASVIIERRINLKDLPASPSPRPVALPSPTSSSFQSDSPSSQPSMSGELTLNGARDRFSESTPYSTPYMTTPTQSVTELSPLIPRTQSMILNAELGQKVVSTSITGVQSSGQFGRTADGIWNKTLTLQWPSAKSNSRWAIGESINSDLVSVKFFARIKVIVSSPINTESIDLADQELTVISTNDAERQLALAKSAHNSPRPRSKSKSPRRSKRDREPETPLPSPPPRPPTASPGEREISMAMSMLPSNGMGRPSQAQKLSHGVVPVSTSKPKTKPKVRRPHTSAGPRDKVIDFGEIGSGFGHVHGGNPSEKGIHSKRAVAASSRPDTAVVVVSGGGFGPASPKTPTQKVFVAPKMSGKSSYDNTSSSSSASMTSTNGSEVGVVLREIQAVEVREWEEELIRIEQQSRRSSISMMGFAHASLRRKRMNGVS